MGVYAYPNNETKVPLIAIQTTYNILDLRYMETQTKKNEIFVKYWSLYLHNTDCNAACLNASEKTLFSPLKYEKNEKKNINNVQIYIQ